MSDFFRNAVAEEFRDGLKLFESKNADYGSAFEDCMDEYKKAGLSPLLAALPRLLDKSGRITNLVLGGKAQVMESIIDTLRDLGAYCYMTAAWLAINTPVNVTLTDAPTETTPSVGSIDPEQRWW